MECTTLTASPPLAADERLAALVDRLAADVAESDDDAAGVYLSLLFSVQRLRAVLRERGAGGSQ